MWKEEDKQETSELASREKAGTTSPVQVTTPTAKRAILIFVTFFLLQIVVGMLFGIALSSMYILNDGDPNNTEALTTYMESYAMQIGLLVSGVSSIIFVLWLWMKIKNPKDGFTLQFIGLSKCSLASLRRPAAIGAGLGFGYLIIASMLLPVAEGSEFGPMATMATSSGWSLVIWVVSILLFAPIVEELLFRGVLLKGFLQSWPTPPGSYIAISITILGFTSLHYQEFVYYPFAAVAIFLMAGAATYFRLKTGNIFAAWAVHQSYNLTLVFFVLAARLAT